MERRFLSSAKPISNASCSEYQTVRAAEGRGSEDPEYYLALPYRDLSGRNVSQWAIRARTFRYIERKILPPLEAVHPAAMKVLDLGAGNGWMSYRLALRGHRPAAVDLLTNDQDGLGRRRPFPAEPCRRCSRAFRQNWSICPSLTTSLISRSLTRPFITPKTTSGPSARPFAVCALAER